MGEPTIVIFWLATWAIPEIVQRLRGKGSRNAMKMGAIWATVLMTIWWIGHNKIDDGSLMLFAAGSYAAVMALIYWIRVGIGRMVFGPRQ